MFLSYLHTYFPQNHLKKIWKWIKIIWDIYFFACKLKYSLNVPKAKSLEDILLLTKSVLSRQNP